MGKDVAASVAARVRTCVGRNGAGADSWVRTGRALIDE